LERLITEERNQDEHKQHNLNQPSVNAPCATLGAANQYQFNNINFKAVERFG
jgi:hypothetical protein